MIIFYARREGVRVLLLVLWLIGFVQKYFGLCICDLTAAGVLLVVMCLGDFALLLANYVVRDSWNVDICNLL